VSFRDNDPIDLEITLFSLERLVVPLQNTRYSLVNCSFMHLKISYAYICNYLKIWKKEFVRVWSPGLKWGNKPLSRKRSSEHISVFIKFSTSDNAILASWLVHWISVTSHYTCVWPYMEMNAIDFARHKLFRVKPSFFDKKNAWWKKTRFGELSTGEIQKIMDNAVPVRTKKATTFHIRFIFSGTYTLSFFKSCKTKVWPSRFYAFIKIMYQKQYILP